MVRLEELKVLKDVPSGSEFRLADGRTIRNVAELYSAIRKMKPEVFYFHVNEEKNDFSNWIRDVQQDKTLADSLHPSMKAKDCIEVLSKRIYDIEKASEDVNRRFKNHPIPSGAARKDKNQVSGEVPGKRPKKIKKKTSEKTSEKRLENEISKSSKPKEKVKGEEPLASIDDPVTAEKKIGLLADETGELILPEGGAELVEEAEANSEIKRRMTERLKKTKDFVDVKEFASDMRKVFTIDTGKSKKRRKIDELKRVCDNDKE